MPCGKRRLGIFFRVGRGLRNSLAQVAPRFEGFDCPVRADFGVGRGEVVGVGDLPRLQVGELHLGNFDFSDCRAEIQRDLGFAARGCEFYLHGFGGAFAFVEMRSGNVPVEHSRAHGLAVYADSWNRAEGFDGVVGASAEACGGQRQQKSQSVFWLHLYRGKFLGLRPLNLFERADARIYGEPI